MITFAQVRKLCPGASSFLVGAVVDDWPLAEAAGITTHNRIAAFLATIATETGGLRSIDENLNYSAARLRQVWPSRFKSQAAAAAYEHNPEKLANKVYGGRLVDRFIQRIP